ncbi:hypothetical protein G6O69_10740 [Pseudenhygromyxa sp. WMMC2535]|uniref:hypothetical protein n=1 Tax=Pseudenhygromyxa sp. WMMC2535 TaxID=2712867 RepID=UPI0015526BB2|nr:hypothetical protein [Pseudenhygromyxa sp. WMMC2535]NVB38309.1 hypothetical protein [Pseudenhygromyxa sp. WMMC2535]
MNIQLHHRTDAEVLASDGPVIYRVINGAPTGVEDALRTFEIIDRALERYAVAGLMVAVEHGSPFPTTEARRWLSENMPRYGDRLVTGYALTGLGFWASSARLITVSIAKLGRITAIIESSVDAIAERMALEVVGLDPRQLVSRVDELQGMLGQGDTMRAATG